MPHNDYRRLQAGAFWLMVCVFLGACGVISPVADAQVPFIGTPTHTPAPTTATPIPTLEATTQAPQSLTVWVPDVLMTTNSDENTDLLSEQIIAYSESENGVSVEIRRKQVRESGGIMPTLRTAKNVAPGVLPDLTLVRREDLLVAVSEDLIEPMEGIVSTAIIGDLFSSALDIGQVDGTLFGLPYALEIQHMVFQPGLDAAEDLGLGGYLTNEIPFLFPAARANALNDTFLIQYLAANAPGLPNSALPIDEDTLFDLYTFYEEAVIAGIITPDVLNYNRATDYRTQILEEPFGSAVVSSALYLELAEQMPELGVASIPTLNGQSATTLNGWMWVMTTSDPNRQAIVGDFLEFMMDVDRQGNYVKSLNLIPSQRTALRRWYEERYTRFVLSIMPNASLPYGTAANGAAARAIQNGLVSVILGERTAAEATQDVMNQLPD